MLYSKRAVQSWSRLRCLRTNTLNGLDDIACQVMVSARTDFLQVDIEFVFGDDQTHNGIADSILE
jgi:hypothetical protein